MHFYDGTIAQLVEQRTENPCVPGSIPGGTTLMLSVLALPRKWGEAFFLCGMGVGRGGNLFVDGILLWDKALGLIFK